MISNYERGDILRFCAIIQASGFSRRMGLDKLKLLIRGKELYKHVLDEVIKVQFEQYILVSKDTEILSYGRELGMDTIYNPDAITGQSKSIVLAVNHMAEVDAMMFFVADQPFLTANTIKKLMDAYSKTDKSIIVPLYNGVRSNPCVFSSKYKSELQNLSGEERGGLIIKNHIDEVEYVNIESEVEGVDIDTPEDYEKYAK